MDIERKSFEIITRELGETELTPDNELVIKRVIHTSADFEYVKNLYFSENVVEKAVKAIKGGVTIVTDTKMVEAGINKKVLAKFNGKVVCFMADEVLQQKLKKEGLQEQL